MIGHLRAAPANLASCGRLRTPVRFLITFGVVASATFLPGSARALTISSAKGISVYSHVGYSGAPGASCIGCGTLQPSTGFPGSLTTEVDGTILDPVDVDGLARATSSGHLFADAFDVFLTTEALVEGIAPDPQNYTGQFGAFYGLNAEARSSFSISFDVDQPTPFSIYGAGAVSGPGDSIAMTLDGPLYSLGEETYISPATGILSPGTYTLTANLRSFASGSAGCSNAPYVCVAPDSHFAAGLKINMEWPSDPSTGEETLTISLAPEPSSALLLESGFALLAVFSGVRKRR